MYNVKRWLDAWPEGGGWPGLRSVRFTLWGRLSGRLSQGSSDVTITAHQSTNCEQKSLRLRGSLMMSAAVHFSTGDFLLCKRPELCHKLIIMTFDNNDILLICAKEIQFLAISWIVDFQQFSAMRRRTRREVEKRRDWQTRGEMDQIGNLSWRGSCCLQMLHSLKRGFERKVELFCRRTQDIKEWTQDEDSVFWIKV